MRTGPSTTSRSPRHSPSTGMLKTTTNTPLVTIDSQHTSSNIQSNNTAKKASLTMHKGQSKATPSNQTHGSTSAPATPRISGYKAPQSSPSSTVNGSSALHPNSTTRVVRPIARRPAEAGSVQAAQETNVSARRSSYVGPQVRPLSSTSSRVDLKQPTTPLRIARLTNDPPRSTSPQFFHANDIKQTRKSNPTPQPDGAKFFHADAISKASSTAHLTPRLPVATQTSSPQSPISSPQLGSSTFGRSVKFVYANGTEEILEPRGKAASTSDGSSRPPSPNPLSSGPDSSTSSTVKYQSPPQSSIGTLSPSQPFSSPTQQRGPLPLGRRSSIDAKSRHGRALSTGASGMPQEIFMAPEVLRSPVASPRVMGENGTEEPPLMAPAMMTLKMREEMAANARRERKVMDLEISNASLLAINRTIERKMRKQTAELRRYRRLARAGQLQPKAASKRRSSRASLEGLEVDLVANGDIEKEEDRDAGDEDEEDEWDEEEEEEEDEELSSSADENENELTADGQPKEPKKRTIARTDQDKMSAELSKHRALLEASAKTNASLKRCTYMIEMLIKEANKALMYRVAVSEVKIGGRILVSDDEEEDDDDGRGETGAEDGDGGVTETEAEDMTGTEAETTDDGQGYSTRSQSRNGDEDDAHTEDEIDS